MIEVNVNDIQPVKSLPRALFHESGLVLIPKGEELSSPILDALQNSDERRFFLAEESESEHDIQYRLRHAEIPVDDLEPGTVLGSPVYDPRGQLLIEAGKPVPKNLAQTLQRRNVQRVQRSRTPEELRLEEGKALVEKLRAFRYQSSQPVEFAQIEEKARKAVEGAPMQMAKPQELSVSNLRSAINKSETLECVPDGEKFGEMVVRHPIDRRAPPEEKKAFSANVKQCLDILRGYYDDIALKRPNMDTDPLDKVVNTILSGLIQNRELMLLCGFSPTEDDYLPRLGLAMAVMSTNIATTLGYGTGQIKSLCYGALLANVGMLQVPQGILKKPGKLNPLELSYIRRHPTLGLEILQSMRQIPREVPYIVFQSHEQPNGQGYPCGKSGVVIHTFAKIVNACEVYTAMCTDRPYRPAMSPHAAMRELLNRTKRRETCNLTMRGFLSCNSLYPVGSFVHLSDGSGGRVVMANANEYAKPVVALLWDGEKKAVPDNRRIDLSAQEELTISRTLNPSEVNGFSKSMIGF